MDRRNKTRHNLRLPCLAGTDTAHATPFEAVTENMSRDGMLMRWLDAIPLPELGSFLDVEVQLPTSPDLVPRVMRCATTVVRVERQPTGRTAVGLRIDKIEFRDAVRVRPGDLESLPLLSAKVN